jgi:hypothetical protein
MTHAALKVGVSMRTVTTLGLIMVMSLTAPLGLRGRGAPAEGPQTRELTPTPLEAFAGNPGSVVVWASPIGRIESQASRAIVTAVAIQDRQSLRIMRGLRIDLVHRVPPSTCNLRFVSHAVLCARPNAAVYFEEDILGRVREGLAQGNAERSLIFSYFQGPVSEGTTGLVIGGYTFEGRQPADLSALVEQGASALAGAPAP